jgi:hypothetical protein
MDCRELKAMMDSYIGDELLIETNHDVLRHIENCADCRAEMASRRMLKNHLRHAVIALPESQIDPLFYSRMSTTLKESALRPGLFERMFSSRVVAPRMLAAGFACILLLTVGALFWMNRSRNDAFVVVDNNTEILNAVKASWAELTRLAVGDHENCAVEFKLKDSPISLDEAATKHGAYNKDLDKAIMAAFRSAAVENTSDVEFIEAHSCIYDGRRFAHVVVRRKGEMVSLLMTETDLPDDSYGIRTAILDGAIGAASFVAGHHAVFVVSKLTESDNAALARAIAPAIRAHLQKPSA